jgi:hypothetical protein
MIRVILPVDREKADGLLPDRKPDGSGVGINYADALLKPVRLTLDDGRKVAIKRRGLKLTLTLGDRSGSGLLRRIAHGPDVEAIVRRALEEAATNAGAAIRFEGGDFILEG